MTQQADAIHAHKVLLKVFDARYHVAACPSGGWCVMDRQRSNLEAGPWASERTAQEVLSFMREHVGVEYA
jgi:hypothetical protein